MVSLPSALEQSLLDEIVARPHEDDPRRVYADYLSERDDPRGSFIADQCQLASTDESDPKWSALYARSERALLEHRETWLAPIRALFDSDPPSLSSFRFRRGLVESMEVQTLTSEQLDAVCRLAPIREIRVPYGRWGRTVEAVRHGLQRGQLDALSSHEDLAGLEAEDLASVSALEISHWRPTWPDRLTQARLRSLSMSRLDNDLTKRIFSMSWFGQLDALSLNDSWIGNTVLDALLDTPSGRPLRLSLARNSRLAPHDHIRALLAWRPIESLDLSGSLNKLTLRRLCIAPETAMLRALALQGDRRANISDSAQRLADVPFTRLTRLDLSHRKLHADAARALLGSPYLQHLVSLDLGHTEVGDEGIAALTRSSITRLTRLVLSHAHTTDRGIAMLAEWPGLAHTVELEIQCNTEGMRALLHSPWLDPSKLDIGWSKRGDPDWEALRERFGSALVRT